MAGYIKPQNIPHHCLDLLHPGVTKLKNLSAVLADQMIVLTEGQRTLVYGIRLSELMPGHEITGQQMLDGIVQGSPADAVVFTLHMKVQGIHIEMIVHGIYFTQDRKPFRGFAKVQLF